MAKEKIKIKGCQVKESKKGKEYVSVDSDLGKMTAFDKEIKENLMKNIGKVVEVEVKESGDFKNIREFYEVVEDKDIEENAKTNTNKGQGENREHFGQTMYVSYAKDIFIAILERAEKDADGRDIMEKAIKLVKQARKEL